MDGWVVIFTHWSISTLHTKELWLRLPYMDRLCKHNVEKTNNKLPKDTYYVTLPSMSQNNFSTAHLQICIHTRMYVYVLKVKRIYKHKPWNLQADAKWQKQENTKRFTCVLTCDKRTEWKVTDKRTEWKVTGVHFYCALMWTRRIEITFCTRHSIN